jgi:glycosyltransferase involved in cell wall biosynthesis
MAKRRILFCSEFSALSTGYGRLYKEIISRVHQTGRFEVFEQASYCSPVDPRIGEVAWPIFPVMPAPGDTRGEQEYNSNPLNQFGHHKFEHSALACRPHIVCDMRDFWYFANLNTSPFRQLYKLALMPTIDAEPLREEWVADAINADAVFTYTDWAGELLEKQGGGKANYLGTTIPGANPEQFFIIPNKAQLKASLGIDPESIVIGIVARNQKRKLYPALFEAFEQFLQTQDEFTREKTLLYVHSTYPDIGWNFAELLKEYGLGNKVIFTYTCRNPGCNNIFPSFFKDARGTCPKCGQYSAGFPTSNQGISNKDLNYIYNLFDVYVQYSACEGVGMPACEAGCAGVPIVVVQYSGMMDYIKKAGAYPIKVTEFSKESETGRLMAIPDNKDLVKTLAHLVRLPDNIRRTIGFETSQLIRKNFNWDDTAAKWIAYFDSVKPVDLWKSPPRIHQPIMNFPPNQSNEQFVRTAIINILGRPDLTHSYLALRMVKDLNIGATSSNQQRSMPYDRQAVVNELLQMAQFNNHWESERLRRIQAGTF